MVAMVVIGVSALVTVASLAFRPIDSSGAPGVAVLGVTASAFALGLFAPGYLSAKLLRSRAAWAHALPISMLILLLGVMLLDAAGVPIRFATLLGFELTVVTLLAVASALSRAPEGRSPDPLPMPEPPERAPAWRGPVFAGVAVVVALAAVRGYLAPLAGLDTHWRWEFLALQLARHETLAFYPPVSGEDFRTYFFPDGFAPIVSTAIWWLYAAAGRDLPVATMPLGLAQLVCALAFVHQTADRLHSRRAGGYAVALLAATPLFVRATMVGQETGLTALTVAGALHALVHARGPRDWRAAVLAGLLVASGTLTREYGLALGGCAVAVVLWRRLGWRTLALLACTVALAAGPWLLRTALRSGNPFYNLGLGLFPVNPVFAGLLEYYASRYGIGALSSEDWLALGRRLLADAGWVALVGLPAAVWLARRHAFLLAGTLVAIGLWLLSIPYSNGGLVYTARVLTPAAVLLSVAAAVALAERATRPARQRLLSVALAATLAYGGARAAIFPLYPDAWGWRATLPLATSRPQPFSANAGALGWDLARLLPAGMRVLGDSTYAHAALVRAGSANELVPIWSPEVAFLADPALGPEERVQRLEELGIGALLLVDGSPNDFFLARWSPLFRYDIYRWTQVAVSTPYVVLWPSAR